MKRLIVFFAILICYKLNAQVFDTEIPFENEEYWWGGVVGYGSKMPYTGWVSEFDLALQNQNNQVVPFFLSNKGRYVWSEYPFRFEIRNDTLRLRSGREQIVVRQAGKTLRDAYLSACRQYFPPSGLLPDSLFFTMPQYNTWIELMYNQNQKDILEYARQVIQNDFPAGILMIDDNWQKYYGNFDFKPECFSNPNQMVSQLHEMGFKIMLWISPFVSPDSPEYRFLAKKGYLLKQKGTDEPALIRWWNGYSACYDLSYPEAFDYFVSQLKSIQDKYGIDGFKFDAGDSGFYNPVKIDSYDKTVGSTDHTQLWAKIGLSFPFNEYRAGWKMGGQALVQRLGDKDYSWNAVKILIPEMIAAGLVGYAYTCPDMIGGGQIGSFLNRNESEFDQNLIIRSTQVHALMPMMQFSVAPWRILSEKNLSIVRSMARLHEKMGSYILRCARESSISGEPIVRSMEYAFPCEGFERCQDQYMLGEKYLIAPVISPENTRKVKFPEGKWKDDQGKIIRGGQTLSIEIPIERLLYFERL
jgi:alpha-glucosidase